MVTGLVSPVSFRLITHSIEPLTRFCDNRFLISNSKGLRNAGILRLSSNCFPFKDLRSIRKVLSLRARSALPNPVIDFSIGIILSKRSEEHTSELQSRENLVCR